MVKLTIIDNINSEKYETEIQSQTLNKLKRYLAGCYGGDIDVFINDIFQSQLDEDEFTEMKELYKLHLRKVEMDNCSSDKIEVHDVDADGTDVGFRVVNEYNGGDVNGSISSSYSEY